MDLRNLKKEKGITLIALAVTIVVLLILAGVTISSVFSENGIIKKAQQAENAIEKAKYNDLNEIEKLEAELEKYTNSNDVAGEDLSEYATLNLQSYVGRHTKQKCDYMKMFIEISNVENEEEKITYAIGTDWNENIIKNNDQNNLFLKSSSQLELLKVNANDVEYKTDSDGTQHMSKIMVVNGFTDVKLSNLYVKKGNNYNIKIGIQAASYSSNTVIPKIVYIYEEESGIVDNNINLNLTKGDIITKYIKIFDMDNNGAVTLDDGTELKNLITNITDENMAYKVLDENDSLEKFIVLINENGDLVSEEAEKYIGFDLDRNGYIELYDVRYIMRYYRSLGSEI